MSWPYTTGKRQLIAISDGSLVRKSNNMAHMGWVWKNQHKSRLFHLEQKKLIKMRENLIMEVRKGELERREKTWKVLDNKKQAEMKGKGGANRLQHLHPTLQS